MIYVVNKRTHAPTKNDFYAGRPSVLGNPFTHISDRKTKAQFVVDSREEAIAKYKPWLREQWKKDIRVRDCLGKLVQKHKNGEDIYLVC